jgi:hypothetical protein
MCALPQTYIGGMEEKRPNKKPGAKPGNTDGSALRSARWRDAVSEGERVHAAAARDVVFWVGRLNERAKAALKAGIEPNEL